jgi:hypothetical protein
MERKKKREKKGSRPGMNIHEPILTQAKVIERTTSMRFMQQLFKGAVRRLLCLK